MHRALLRQTIHAPEHSTASGAVRDRSTGAGANNTGLRSDGSRAALCPATGWVVSAKDAISLAPNPPRDGVRRW